MSIFQVQQKLLNLWITNGVEEAYQATFLSKLDELPEDRAKELMQREILSTYNGQADFYQISKLDK